MKLQFAARTFALSFAKTTVHATLALCAASAAVAAPTVVDMNSMPSDLSVGQSEDGFALQSAGGIAFVGNRSFCGSTCADNGSNNVWSSHATINLRALSGATFDLNAFDAAETGSGMPNTWARAVRVVGRYANGSTVSTEFALDFVNDGPGPLADFQTFWLPSTFSGLTLVSFSRANGDYGQFALDNFALNGSFQTRSITTVAATVAEPGSLALTASALLLASAMLRLRRSPTTRWL